MNRYVEQLIADIYAAQNHEEFELKTEFISLDSYTELDDFFLPENESFKEVFGKVCGINTKQFPSVKLLTDEQMEGICEAIDRLLFSWNLQTDLPDELPVEIAYELLVGIFDKKNTIVAHGFTDIEFCNSTPKTCAFGEFCECRKIDEAIAIREKSLGKEVLNIITKIRNAPHKLPDPNTFALLYPEVNFRKEPVGPLIPVRKWLNLPDDMFPSPDDLTTQQTEAISDTLLQFMNENISDWLSNISPKLRYISLVSYLDVKARFNGKNGLVLIFENPK